MKNQYIIASLLVGTLLSGCTPQTKQNSDYYRDTYVSTTRHGELSNTRFSQGSKKYKDELLHGSLSDKTGIQTLTVYNRLPKVIGIENLIDIAFQNGMNEVTITGYKSMSGPTEDTITLDHVEIDSMGELKDNSDYLITTEADIELPSQNGFITTTIQVFDSEGNSKEATKEMRKFLVKRFAEVTDLTDSEAKKLLSRLNWDKNEPFQIADEQRNKLVTYNPEKSTLIVKRPLGSRIGFGLKTQDLDLLLEPHNLYNKDYMKAAWALNHTVNRQGFKMPNGTALQSVFKDSNSLSVEQREELIVPYGGAWQEFSYIAEKTTDKDQHYKLKEVGYKTEYGENIVDVHLYENTAHMEYTTENNEDDSVQSNRYLNYLFRTEETDKGEFTNELNDNYKVTYNKNNNTYVIDIRQEE